MTEISQPQIADKINESSSVRVKVTCRDHRLLWQDSYRVVDCPLSSDESILYKISYQANQVEVKKIIMEKFHLPTQLKRMGLEGSKNIICPFSVTPPSVLKLGG